MSTGTMTLTALPLPLWCSCFCGKLRHSAFFYLPNRLQEGYGLDIEALKKITREGATLLITVDCGISDIGSPFSMRRPKTLISS